MKTTALLLILSLVLGVRSSTVPTTTEPTRPPGIGPNGCLFENKWYEEGEFLANDNHCRPCTCHRKEVSCLVIDCPWYSCVDSVYDPDHCCPVCPNGPNCFGPNGEIIPGGSCFSVVNNRMCSCVHWSHWARCVPLRPVIPPRPPSPN